MNTFKVCRECGETKNINFKDDMETIEKNHLLSASKNVERGNHRVITQIKSETTLTHQKQGIPMQV